jgi:GNAT superfamily N-acetyltransferase
MTKFRIEYLLPKSQEDKYALMKFVYDNTDSFVMNTFGYLWENRQWWFEHPIMVAYYENTDVIVGLHAFTVSTKATDTLKTYYIVTDKKFKGQGIAKMLTKRALHDTQLWCNQFYVNSNSSDGIAFYTKLVGEPVSRKHNEFGGEDCEFQCSFNYILK